MPTPLAREYKSQNSALLLIERCIYGIFFKIGIYNNLPIASVSFICGLLIAARKVCK